MKPRELLERLGGDGTVGDEIKRLTGMDAGSDEFILLIQAIIKASHGNVVTMVADAFIVGALAGHERMKQ